MMESIDAVFKEIYEAEQQCVEAEARGKECEFAGICGCLKAGIE